MPTDVAVVGFDNWDVMAEAARPPLTSVDMNLDALGREAGASLMEMMAGRELKGVRRLPCSLVIRDSCGARARGEKVGTGFSPKTREIKGARRGAKGGHR